MGKLTTILDYLKAPGRIASYVKGVRKAQENELAYWQLSFERDPDGRWYIICPEYPGSRANLEMVCGADKLLDIMSGNENIANLDVYAFNNQEEVAKAQKRLPEALILEQEEWSPAGGSTYHISYCENGNFEGIEMPKQVWLCPVTLFVLGKYPKYIQFEKRS